MGNPSRHLPRPREVRAYPRRAEIHRAVAAARDMGMAVTTVDVRPDGTIRVMSGRPDGEIDKSEFERWDAAGRL